MVKEWFEDLALNLSQKVRSNILGAIIIVWAFRNWELIYALFYFTEDWSLLERIEWIKDYFPGYTFYVDLLWTVLKAFALIIVTYFLKAGGIYLSRLYEYRLKTYVLGKVSVGELIPTKEYNILEAKLKRSETRVSEERQRRIDEESRAEEKEKQLIGEKSKKQEQSTEIDKLNDQIARLKEQLIPSNNKQEVTVDMQVAQETINDQLEENTTREVYENNDVSSISLYEGDLIDNILDTVEINKWSKRIRIILREVTNGAVFTSTIPEVQFLNDQDILTQNEIQTLDDYRYELTDFGKKFKKRFYQTYGLMGTPSESNDEKMMRLMNSGGDSADENKRLDNLETL
jgi:hypothetical protein